MLVYQRVMGLNGCFCIVFNHQQTSGMDIMGLNGDTIEVSSGNQTWLSGKIHSKWKLVAEKKTVSMVSCHCYIWLPFGWFWWVSDHPPVLAHSRGLDMTVSLGGIHGRWSSCNEFCGGQKVANTSNSLKSPWDHWHILLKHVILHL